MSAVLADACEGAQRGEAGRGVAAAQEDGKALEARARACVPCRG